MKIAFLVNRFPPLSDGIGDYTYFLSRKLLERGHNISVFCAAGNTLLLTQEQEYKILPIIDKWTRAGFSRALNELKILNPDVLILQYEPFSFGMKGFPVFLPQILRTCKKYCKKTLIFFHEPFIRRKFFPISWFFRFCVQRKVAGALCKLADIICTSIDLYKLFLGQVTKAKVNIIPVGANIIYWDRKNNIGRNELRKKITEREEIIISTFGVRKHEMLIAMLDQLAEVNLKYKLVICGKVENERLFQQKEKDVYLTGYLSATEIYQYLEASDLFILPDPVDQKGEGGTSNKSGSLAAALAAGLPVVGIKGDMNNKLLNKIPALYLWDKKTPQNLMNAMLFFINSPGIGLQNQRFFLDYLSWDIIADEYMNLIK